MRPWLDSVLLKHCLLEVAQTMESSSRQDGASLSNLIHELSDFLQAQSEESTTTTPHSGSSTLAPRMRTVLLALLSECLEFRIGEDRVVALQ